MASTFKDNHVRAKDFKEKETAKMESRNLSKQNLKDD